MQRVLSGDFLPALVAKRLGVKHSILVKGMLAPADRLTRLGISCVPTKYNVHSAQMEYRIRFRNGRELTAKGEDHLNSDEFYAACLMLYDLPPEGM